MGKTFFSKIKKLITKLLNKDFSNNNNNMNKYKKDEIIEKSEQNNPYMMETYFEDDVEIGPFFKI